jgi:hypothetical protein
MASTLPPLLIQLVADVSQLKTGLAQAQAAIKGVDDNVKKTSTGMTNFVGNLKKVGAALGTTFAATQVVAFAKQSIMAASNMEESLSKVRVVFGEGAAEVEKFGASAAQNLGISNQAALEAAGTYGNLFQAFGLGQGEAQKMSTSLVQLAADMASFNNTSIDQAITALRSGLSGETEPLKRFGVALSEVRLKEEALRMGLIETTKGTLPVAIKSQAAYALIMRDTALAQGDYARTADGTANTMKTLQAKIEDAKVALGEALMPAFRALLKILEMLIPVLTRIGEFFKNNQAEVKAFAITVGVLGAAWGAYTVFVKAAIIQQKILNLVQKLNPLGAIIIVIGLVVAAMVKLYRSNETFRKAVIAMAKVALNAFAAIIPMIGQVFEAIMKVTSGPLRLLLLALSKLPGVGKYAKAGLDLMNKGLDGISDFANAASKKAKDLAAGLDKMGAAADKNAKKVTKATKGATTTTKAVDTEAQKKAADEAKKLLEKKQEIEMSYIEAQISAHEKYQEKVADLRKDYNNAMAEADEADRERREDAMKTYNAAVEDAQKSHTRDMVDIAKDYAKKTADIEESLQKKIIDLREAAATKSADLRIRATEKETSIIRQSMDRLRSAFASGTSFSLTESFKGKTSGGLLAQMKKELDAAKKLQEGAAYLAGQGYAQTFIEQVVKAGPEVGNQMLDELKKSSPEQQKEIQNTFMDLESIQETGLDQLAKTMSNGANLATSELRQAYDQVAIDLKNSLAEVDRELMTSLAEANAEYARAMTTAKVERDARMLEAATQLQAAIAEAKTRLDAALAESAAQLTKAREAAQARLNEGLAEAQRVLQQSLIEAQKEYEKAIDEIAASTAQKLANLKKLLAEIAAATAALKAGGGGGGGGGGTTLTPKELEDLKKKDPKLIAANYTVVPQGGSNVVTSKMGGTRDIGNLSPLMQASVLRSIELQAETERMRQERAAKADARLNITQNFTATKVDAQDVAVATVNAVKFGAAVTVGSTSADIVASRKQMYGEL